MRVRLWQNYMVFFACLHLLASQRQLGISSLLERDGCTQQTALLSNDKTAYTAVLLRASSHPPQRPAQQTQVLGVWSQDEEEGIAFENQLLSRYVTSLHVNISGVFAYQSGNTFFAPQPGRLANTVSWAADFLILSEYQSNMQMGPVGLLALRRATT